MSGERTAWIIWPCVGLFVGVALIPTRLYPEGWRLLSGNNAADWAQFFGGVMAVVAAIAIARGEAARARHARIETRRDNLAAAVNLATTFVRRAEICQNVLAGSSAATPVPADQRAALRVKASAMASFPLKELDSGEMVESYLDLVTVAEIIRAQLEGSTTRGFEGTVQVSEEVSWGMFQAEYRTYLSFAQDALRLLERRVQ